MSPALNMLLLLLLLLLSPDDGQTQHVSGQKRNGSCLCAVDSSLWSFPAVKYESVLQQVESCGVSLNSLQEQVILASQRLPEFQALVENITARLEPYQYLHDRGLYTALSLRQLGQELTQLETDVDVVHSQLNNTETQRLSKEVGKFRKDVHSMQTSDTINMKTVREKLRYLKNSAESCKSIPKDFRGQDRHCFKGLITSISEPVKTKISPYGGKSYTAGSWGKQAQLDSEEQKNSYWVVPLINGNIQANSLRVFQNDKDFMASANHKDYTFAPSYSHANAMEGPGAVLYGEALYYHCYRSADICRYDLKSNTVKRVTLPGSVGYTNKFPYCYFSCRDYSEVDVEADETGLWAIYATVSNHGNMVVSRLVWDSVFETLNVTQTWETRQFKKAVTNAFMVCGVLYATRYVDNYREEVFYAFDTATGKEDNSLALPLEKVANGVASVSYNPTDKQIYMYNDAYLLAYEVHF